MAREKNVTMEHPEIKGKAIASQTAFDKVWSKKGWVVAKPEAETEERAKTRETLQNADKGPNSENIRNAPSA